MPEASSTNSCEFLSESGQPSPSPAKYPQLPRGKKFQFRRPLQHGPPSLVRSRLPGCQSWMSRTPLFLELELPEFLYRSNPRSCLRTKMGLRVKPSDITRGISAKFIVVVFLKPPVTFTNYDKHDKHVASRPWIPSTSTQGLRTMP